MIASQPMKYSKVTREAINLIGYQSDIEDHTPIAAAFGHYFQNQIFNSIPNRIHPMRTYCAGFEHREFEGKKIFTLIIGEEVSKIDLIPKDLKHFAIPKSDYLVFRTETGKASELAKIWQDINSFNFNELGLKRTNIDFEQYGEDQIDFNNMYYDVYIGVEQKQN